MTASGGLMAAVSAMSFPDAPARAGARPVKLVPSRLSEVPGPVLGAVVGLSYAALAQYVIWLNDPVNAGAGYWPGAGLTLAALLLLPVRRWGWVVGAIMVAEIGVDTLHDYPLAASAWWAVANAVEPVVAALLLRRLGGGGRLSPLGRLVPFLIIGVVVGPFVGAAIGSIGTSTVYDTSQLDVLLKWWAGDGLGVLVVAPLLLCFRERPFPSRSTPEIALVAALVVGAPLLAYRDWHGDWDLFLPYLILPVLMWVSVRFGIRGAAVAGFVTAEVANLSTALGDAPIRLAPDLHAVTVLQVFLATSLIAALVIATLVHDALDRTRQYERERAVADAFQTAALPGQLTVVSGLSWSAAYAAASTDGVLHIGGDWYDVFPLPDGATGLVIGDVNGHDLGAAVVMGELRNGLRSLLFQLQDPSQAMRAMDRQLAVTMAGALATVIVAVYTDGELSWTNAGHPPLLVAPHDGPLHYCTERANPMLGLGGSRYDTNRTHLEEGDLVVAYTDGVMEHRSWTFDEGLAHLESLVAAAPRRDPQHLCDLLLAEGLGGRNNDDDACILVLQRVGPEA